MSLHGKLIYLLEGLGILRTEGGGKCIHRCPVKLEDSQADGLEEYVTLRINPSDRDEFGAGRAKQLVLAIANSRPKAFELFGCEGQCFVQIACSRVEAEEVADQIVTCYPNTEVFSLQDQSLLSEIRIARCYRLRHFAIPFETKFSFDPYTSLMGIFS